MSGMIDQIFKVVNVAGWFIGIFAVLVGAFGIANIMFVSVKESTSIIGIQKALGAKSYYIILEVLNESVLLSMIGGSLGLLLIFAGTFIARAQDFEIFLSTGNIVLGLIHQHHRRIDCGTDACLLCRQAESGEGNCQYFLGTRLKGDKHVDVADGIVGSGSMAAAIGSRSWQRQLAGDSRQENLNFRKFHNIKPKISIMKQQINDLYRNYRSGATNRRDFLRKLTLYAGGATAASTAPAS